MAIVSYYLDGINLVSYGVYVSKSDGLFSRPRLKAPVSMSWNDHHGDVVDLSSRYYDSREIKLSCFILASSSDDFTLKATAFLALFDATGTRRLMVDAGATKDLFFEVYISAGIDIAKTWDAGNMAGTFTLTLIEPAPVKRVLRFIRSSGNTTCEITITTTKVVDIFWGDGTVTKDVYGTSNLVTHSYASDGSYFIIIAGDIDNITSLTSDATVIWTKL